MKRSVIQGFINIVVATIVGCSIIFGFVSEEIAFGVSGTIILATCIGNIRRKKFLETSGMASIGLGFCIIALIKSGIVNSKTRILVYMLIFIAVVTGFYNLLSGLNGYLGR